MKPALSGVVAGSGIPLGATVGPLSGELTFGRDAGDDAEVKQRIQVLYEEGTFKCTCMPGLSWASLLGAARDRYDQNMEVFRHHDNQTYIRTIRPIRQGDHMLIWYHDSFAMERGIPFLTPANIQGAQAYTCTTCTKTFRYPNSLKSHIRFHCVTAADPSDKNDNSRIPILRHPSPASHQKKSEPTKGYVDTKPCAIDHVDHCLQCNHLSGIPCRPKDVYATGQGYIDMRFSEDPSYMTPRYQPINYYQVTCNMRSSPIMCPYTFETRFSFTPMAEKKVLQNHRGVSEKLKCLPENDDGCLQSEFDEEPIDILHNSLIEMSSSKGHLCVYCGKFYSRKYGLKIHLRTHTGYKPLKCKVCFRPFGDPSNLNKHIRLHSEGDTPYTCRHCGKVLVRKRDLVRHVKSRHQRSTISDIKMEPNCVAE